MLYLLLSVIFYPIPRHGFCHRIRVWRIYVKWIWRL